MTEQNLSLGLPKPYSKLDSCLLYPSKNIQLFVTVPFTTDLVGRDCLLPMADSLSQTLWWFVSINSVPLSRFENAKGYNSILNLGNIWWDKIVGVSISKFLFVPKPSNSISLPIITRFKGQTVQDGSHWTYLALWFQLIKIKSNYKFCFYFGLATCQVFTRPMYLVVATRSHMCRICGHM